MQKVDLGISSTEARSSHLRAFFISAKMDLNKYSTYKTDSGLGGSFTLKFIEIDGNGKYVFAVQNPGWNGKILKFEGLSKIEKA